MESPPALPFPGIIGLRIVMGLPSDSNKTASTRIIAYYLPQFHPIPENNEWWGPGFTEWNMVMKARPLFHGHYQPHFPGELGFYDLRIPEVRQAQAELARTHGIEAFCYWHYWLGHGRRLLERPFEEVLQTGEPDFPFCLAWANRSWQSLWRTASKRVLASQVYPGDKDHRAHVEALLDAFADPRYVKVGGKPLFVVLYPKDVPDIRRVTDLWRERVEQAGLRGLHLVGLGLKPSEVAQLGFDATTHWRHRDLAGGGRIDGPLSRMGNIVREVFHRPRVTLYHEVIRQLTKQVTVPDCEYPAIAPNWDNTPRFGWRGTVLHDARPEYFRLHLNAVIGLVANRAPERRIIFVRSWNEWAEGNHLEPDERYGRGYLAAIQRELYDAAVALDGPDNTAPGGST